MQQRALSGLLASKQLGFRQRINELHERTRGGARRTRAVEHLVEEGFDKVIVKCHRP